MSEYIIRGGRKLSGKIKTESAKNAVLPILCASVMTNEEVVIKNCPKIADVLVMTEILKQIGCRLRFEENSLIIDPSNVGKHTVESVLASELRSSVFMLGALLARLNKAKIYQAGGCKIGARPIDIHLSGLKKLGVKVTEMPGYVQCEAEKLKGAEITLKYPSVGATENLIMAACAADGETLLHNCAREPEVADLARFINSMGGKIKGAGGKTVTVEGVKKLRGTVYEPIGDRIEAGTYLIAVAATGGEIEIGGVGKKNILPLINKLCDNTCNFRVKNDIIQMRSSGRGKPFALETSPFPGFPTDLQEQMTALACFCSGSSVIRETVFETRFNQVSELKKMGADIALKGDSAFVTGTGRLFGAEVSAHDLRGGAALVIAGLAAEGETRVSDEGYIYRGYFSFDQKLRSLGADVLRK